MESALVYCPLVLDNFLKAKIPFHDMSATQLTLQRRYPPTIEGTGSALVLGYGRLASVDFVISSGKRRLEEVERFTV
jgi:hypothetical protein